LIGKWLARQIVNGTSKARGQYGWQKSESHNPVALICVLSGFVSFQLFHHLVDVSQASYTFWV